MSFLFLTPGGVKVTPGGVQVCLPPLSQTTTHQVASECLPPSLPNGCSLFCLLNPSEMPPGKELFAS